MGTGVVRTPFGSTDGAGTPLVLWLADVVGVTMGCIVIDTSVEDDRVMLDVPMLVGVSVWES